MYEHQESPNWQERSIHGVPRLQPVYEEGFPKSHRAPQRRNIYQGIDPMPTYELILFTGDRCKATIRESEGHLEWLALTDTDFSRAGQRLNPGAVAAWSHDR